MGTAWFHWQGVEQSHPAIGRKSMTDVQGPVTGSALRGYRRAAGLSQIALADHAGVSRETVQYWESKPVLDTNGWGPKRLFEALGLRVLWTITRARGWGLSGRDSHQGWLDQQIAAEMTRQQAGSEIAKARRRVVCAAKTRKGKPCRNKSEPGRRRCKYHGGMSTGPRTPEGRQRIAQAQRRRWAGAQAPQRACCDHR